MAKMRWPFQRPEYMEGLTDAQVEASLGEDNIHTTRALHWNIQATSIFALTGLALLIFNLVMPEHKLLVPIPEYKTIEDMLNILGAQLLNTNWLQMVGRVIVFLLFGYISPYIADAGVRVVVYTLGFTVSLDPGRVIRNYVYTWELKLIMAIMGALLSGVYFLLWIAGLAGWITSFWDMSMIDWAWTSNKLAIGAVVLACVWLWLAFVFWPATRIRVQDHETLFEAMILVEGVHIWRLNMDFKKKMVELATPLVAGQLVDDIKERGPAALQDWLEIEPKHYKSIASAIYENRSQIAAMRAKAVGGQTHIAVTHRDGTSRVYPAPRAFAAPSPTEPSSTPVESTSS